MSETAALQTQTTKATQNSSAGLLLQRKCACDGSSGLTGSCTVCEKKKLLGQPLQMKLRVNEPGDEYEQEADRVAEQVMRIPDASVNPEAPPMRAAPLVQRRAAGTSGAGIVAAPPVVQDVLASPGQPLDAETRAFFEPRFGHDFSKVRVHTDAKSADSAWAVNAQAYSTGRHIVFGHRQFRPHTTEGKELVAHELSHIVQQGSAEQRVMGTHLSVGRSELPLAPIIQRRLLVTGAPADVQDMLSLLEPAVGQDLEHDPKTGHVEIAGPLPNPAESKAAQRIITGIVDDRARDAEIQLGTAQIYSTEVPLRHQEVGVHMGQFPFPTDLTGKKTQTIDIDDIRELENGSPGHGVAALIHEIAENYHAHSLIPQGGVSGFEVSHRAGLEAQSDVAEELVGAGRRVAGVEAPTPGGSGTRIITDYENYYVVFDKIQNAATGSTDVVSARKVPRITVNAYAIDQFDSGMRALPPTAPAIIASVSGDLVTFPTATVRIEGYSDGTGTDKPNLRLTTIRAELVRDAIINAGAIGGENRFHVIGYGASKFVAPNNSEANRALNRRVVITIDRPDI